MSNLFTVTNGLISFPPPETERAQMPLRAFDVPRHSPPPSNVFAMNHNIMNSGAANVRKTYGNGVRRAVSTMALSWQVGLLVWIGCFSKIAPNAQDRIRTCAGYMGISQIFHIMTES